MSALLVASTGGHLVELMRLRPRLTGIGDEVTWVTFDTPQSRSMLAGEDVQLRAGHAAHAPSPQWRRTASPPRVSFAVDRCRP